MDMGPERLENRLTRCFGQDKRNIGRRRIWFGEIPRDEMKFRDGWRNGHETCAVVEAHFIITPAFT